MARELRPQPASTPPLSSGGRRRILRSPWLWATILGVVGIPAIRPFLRHIPDPPPVTGSLPSFHLVDESGRPFGIDQMRGHVHVVGLFRAAGDTDAPVARAMQQLHARYSASAAPVKLLGILREPAYGARPALSRYAPPPGSEPRRWHILSGAPQEVRRLLEGSFGLQVQAGRDEPGNAPGGRLALIDTAGNVRGLYRADSMGVDEVYHRSRHLLRDARAR